MKNQCLSKIKNRDVYLYSVWPSQKHQIFKEKFSECTVNGTIILQLHT